MTAMLLLLSMGLLVKNYKINTKILSDFKIWNQNHTQKIGLSSRELRTFIDRRNGSSNGELYTILTNKAAKERKEP
jgi:hypothetical protein